MSSIAEGQSFSFSGGIYTQYAISFLNSMTLSVFFLFCSLFFLSNSTNNCTYQPAVLMNKDIDPTVHRFLLLTKMIWVKLGGKVYRYVAGIKHLIL